MQVINVNGMGRSGTTALAAALGGADSTVYVGELKWLARDLSEDRTCTCGRTARTCEVWGLVWILLRRRGWSSGSPWWEHGPAVLQQLGEQAGVERLVDSSKGLLMAQRLSSWAPTEVVWVRRRWAGGGWLRKQPGRVEQQGFGPLAARLWYEARRTELAIGTRLLPGVDVHHDELMGAPDETFERLCSHFHLSASLGGELRFPHILTANRCRFFSGRRLGEIP